MPQLILLSFLVLAAWLIKRDTAIRDGVSSAVWIPTIWVGILASRPVSIWIGISGNLDTLDGSPLDRMFYLGMIGSALWVLSRRGVDWADFFSKNWAIVFFYSFFLISVLWANSPFSSLKRWTKEIGNIFIAMVILTEVNPLQACRVVFVRCAYVLIPLSIIFIRYFPNLGRRYGMHGGALESIGVTTQKNSLGTMVLVVSLILLWDWMERSRPGALYRGRLERWTPPLVGAIGVWLIQISDSKTSILCLAIGALIIAAIRIPFLRSRVRALGVYFLLAGLAFFTVDWLFDITPWILQSLGRDPTLTGRADVWRELLALHTDPILGVGFMSFWDTREYREVLPGWVSGPAHNGYLEIYLAGGAVGIVVLVIMLLGTGARINRALAGGGNFAVVRFAVYVAMLIANYAESNFAFMTPLGFLFLLMAIGEVRHAAAPYSFVESPSDAPPSTSDSLEADSNEPARAPVDSPFGHAS